MDIKEKIKDIVNHIFENHGSYQYFPKKTRLLIHDNIHGTLRFNKTERKIINSPFLQRLTLINQMGLAHYVYPGAVHNRFSHSLGVPYLAEKIYSNIKKFKINQKDINTLKLAGLLHDIGHGPFSHVTDKKIYKMLIGLPKERKSKIRIDYNIFDKPDKIQRRKNIHEIIGYHIIKSKRTQDFLNKIYSCMDIDLDLVPLCITGNEKPYPDKNGHYHSDLSEDDKLFVKIINGFSDADKIDYILRDSHFSGLPLPIDFDRLLPFFTILKHGETFELGVFAKGARAFHLLLQSKSKMFPTVYEHHTTLACETLLRYGIINAMENVDTFENELDKDIYIPIKGPLDLLYHTDNSLMRYLKVIKNPISNDVVSRLYTRRHYRRAIQLFVWHLEKKLIISYRDFLKYYSKYNNRKILESNHDKKESFKEFIKKQGRKIYDFPELFNEYDKRLDFKDKIISHIKWRKILSKLPKALQKIDEEILKDYIIKIEFTSKFENKPYIQPYILREDVFTGKKEYLTLQEMGFSGPSDKEHLQYIFYVLPELKKLLVRYIRRYIKEFFGELLYIN